MLTVSPVRGAGRFAFRVVGVGRLTLAGIGVIALISRFLYGMGFRSFASENFLAYLTIQCNIAAVVVTSIAGVVALRGRPDTAVLSALRAAVLSFQLVAGVVFAALAISAPAQGYRLEVPPSDQVLHFWLPSLALLDWLLSPGRHPVRWRTLLPVVGYPVGWGLLTIARGAAVGWYPYFFLDPAQVSAGEFVLYTAVVLALFVGVGAGLIGISRARPPAGLAPWTAISGRLRRMGPGRSGRGR